MKRPATTASKAKSKAKKAVAAAIATAVVATPTVVEGKKLYKVLSPTGESQNGGSMKWSLPEGDKPGDWHETPSAIMCTTGLHLTSDPVTWWKPNCRVFEVEADELAFMGGKVYWSGDKVVARRARLVRELSDAELVAVGIIRFGTHEVREGRVIAEGSSQVAAYDSSQVTAYGSSQVTAYGSSKVAASDSSQVAAYDSSQVTAYGSSQVTAYGSSKVAASDSSQVAAYDSSQVTAYGSSQVTASGSSQVAAYDSSQVAAYDSSQVTAYGSSQVAAYDSSQVAAYDSSQVTASGTCLVGTWKTYWGNNASVTLAEQASHVDYRNGAPTFHTAGAK